MRVVRASADNPGYVILREQGPERTGSTRSPTIHRGERTLRTMTPDELVEIEMIKRLKYAYARSLDLKLWDELAKLFTEDAVATYSGGGYTFEGRDAILDFLQRSMGAETFHSSHKMHHPEIDLTGPNDARRHLGARRRGGRDGVGDHDPRLLLLRGQYVKVAGSWRIKRTGYRRVFEEIQPRGNVEGLRLTASWWATDGRSELPAG